MNWFWKVRLYTAVGNYAIVEVKTNRILGEIGTIQDFYEELMGAKMLLEGMSDTSFGLRNITDAFYQLITTEDPRGP